MAENYLIIITSAGCPHCVRMRGDGSFSKENRNPIAEDFFWDTESFKKIITLGSKDEKFSVIDVNFNTNNLSIATPTTRMFTLDKGEIQVETMESSLPKQLRPLILSFPTMLLCTREDFEKAQSSEDVPLPCRNLSNEVIKSPETGHYVATRRSVRSPFSRTLLQFSKGIFVNILDPPGLEELMRSRFEKLQKLQP